MTGWTNVKGRTNAQGKVRWTAQYMTPDGKWRSAGTYGDRRVAQRKATAALDAAQQVGWVDPAVGRSTTLAAYAADVWMPSLAVEVRTRMNYASAWRKHIEPVLGSKVISSITHSVVATWLAQMDERGVGRSSQHLAYMVLRSIFNSARRDGLVLVSPCQDVRPRPVEKHLPRIFTRAQWASFIQHVPEQWVPLLKVGMLTGMRPSELRALAPDAIHWDLRTIDVRRAMVQANAALGTRGRWVEKAYPKGRRSRTIKVDDEVLEILYDAIEVRGLDPASSEPIFLINGQPFSVEDSLIVFRRACAKASLPNLTMKHLRSSKASWMLKDTGDLMAVKEHLGHADLSTTQRYLAVVEETTEDNVSGFERFKRERSKMNNNH